MKENFGFEYCFACTYCFCSKAKIERARLFYGSASSLEWNSELPADVDVPLFTKKCQQIVETYFLSVPEDLSTLERVPAEILQKGADYIPSFFSSPLPYFILTYVKIRGYKEFSIFCILTCERVHLPMRFSVLVVFLSKGTPNFLFQFGFSSYTKAVSLDTSNLSHQSDVYLMSLNNCIS